MNVVRGISTSSVLVPWTVYSYYICTSVNLYYECSIRYFYYLCACAINILRNNSITSVLAYSIGCKLIILDSVYACYTYLIVDKNGVWCHFTCMFVTEVYSSYAAT